MWIAKFEYNSKGTLIGTQTEKHKVNLFAFPLSFQYEKDCILVQIAGTLFGSSENKKDFVSELKKNPRVINLELNEDFLIGTIKEPLFAKAIYNKDIFHLSPAFISEQCFERVFIGSFEKEKLTKIIKLFKEKYSGKLISIEQKKIKSISIVKLRPELTEQQRMAMDLAIKEGYYHSPRKTSVEQLAKMAKLSFSTFQVHLRKAEEKLIPYMFE